MTDKEIEHIRDSYKTVQHLILGHVYRDIMKLVNEVIHLKELVKSTQGESHEIKSSE